MNLRRSKSIIAITLAVLTIVLVSLYYVQCNYSQSKNYVQLQDKEENPSLFGINMQEMNQDQILKNLIEQTDEFGYYDNEREGIKRVLFCGVPCGLNIQSEQKNGTTVATSVVLFTSLQDKETFDNLKNSISKKYGNPDIEEYEGGAEEIDGKYYGRCKWDNGAIVLRNVQSDEGGLLITISPSVNKGSFSGKINNSKEDSCIKTKFTWKDSKGDEFPVYMNSGGSCFIIRTSKSGEDYRAYLGKEVSEQICRELKMKNIRNN